MLSRLFSDLNGRLARLEAQITTFGTYDISVIQYIPASSYAVDNQAIAAAATYTTGDLRGVNGVSSKALGIIGILRGTPAAGGASLYIADSAPSQYNCRLDCPTAAEYSTLVFVRLNTDGTVIVQANTQNFTGVYLVTVGWFK